jgi:hypothetical protein
VRFAKPRARSLRSFSTSSLQSTLAVTTVQRLAPELREYVATTLAQRHLTEVVLPNMTGAVGRVNGKTVLLPKEISA